MSGPRGVVITGVGFVSTLGGTSAEALDAMLAGRTGVAPLTDPELEFLPCRLGARITGFRGQDWVDNRKNLRLMTPAVQYGLAAVRKAADAAGLAPGVLPPDRLGMFVGAGTAFGDGRELLPALQKGIGEEGFDVRRFATEGVPLINPLWLLKGLSNNVLGFATASLDAQGINQNYCTSGAGGLQAIGEAAWALTEGRADAIVAGGADSAMNPEHYTGFARLGLLTEGHTPDAVRPFDARHDGFAPGEGAAFFTLETEESARRRGRPVLARVVGFGDRASAGTPLHAEPESVAAACRRAIEGAGWTQVDAVWAHGNANPGFDDVEARALREVFGARTPPVTADKGQLGHAIAAAGPLSLALALEAGRRGVLPAVAHLETPAPHCAGVDFVAGEPRQRTLRRVLVHAAGLGGQTTFLAVELPEVTP